MIHIINQYPVQSTELAKAKSGDTLLFIENAVLELKKRDKNLYAAKKMALIHINLCVRKTDLTNRGLKVSEIANNVAIIDDQEYLLVLNEETIIRSWN